MVPDFVTIDEAVSEWMAAHKSLTINRDGDTWTLYVWAKVPGREAANMKRYELAHPDFMHAIVGLVRLAIQDGVTR
jgi:hypothetical protein